MFKDEILIKKLLNETSLSVDKQNIQSKQNSDHMFDGVVNVYSNNIIVNYSSQIHQNLTKDQKDKIEFMILDLVDDVFYKIRKLKQFFDSQIKNINYQVFYDSLNDEEKSIIKKYFGIKRKLYSNKNYKALTSLDTISIQDSYIIPIVEVKQKYIFIMVIENKNAIDKMFKGMIQKIEEEKAKLLSKETKDQKIIKITLFKNESGVLDVKVETTQIDKKYNDVLNLISDNKDKFKEGIKKFIEYSATYTKSNIDTIKEIILKKMESVIFKFDTEKVIDEKQITQVTENKVVSQRKVVQNISRPAKQNLLDDILSELSDKEDKEEKKVLTFEEIISEDNVDDEEIPF